MVAVFSDNAEVAAKARAANVNHKAAMLGRKLLRRVRAKGVHEANQLRIAEAKGTLNVRLWCLLWDLSWPWPLLRRRCYSFIL